EQDAWQNRTDPLATRHLPGSNDGQRIERADIERAAADGYIALPWPGKQVRMRASWLRIFIICMVALVVVGFAVDGLLVSLSLQHPSHAANMASSSNHLPTLMLSNNKVSNGQSVVVHILHFTPSGFVFLSHDIGEQVKTDAGSGKIQVGKNGSRDVTLLIDNSWAAGAHTLEAEDMLTRYSASASLLLASGQTRPSQFGLDDARMDLGVDQQGANTLRTLTLRNSNGGSGAISWSASSDQPWLLFTPNQGTFSNSQVVVIGVQRNNLKPGSYQGVITFISNVGRTKRVDVTMSVRPLPAHPGAVLSLTPVATSFTTVDGSADAQTPQYVQVNNPGTSPLYWSLASNAPDTSASQVPIENANWLSLAQSSGTVSPGTTALLPVHVQGSSLLPGVYINTLKFTDANGHTAQNDPQTMALSLTVQPRCGVSLTTGNLSFTAVVGQGTPNLQSLGLSSTTSCSTPIRWQATSMANWVTLSPASGQLNGSADASVAVGVNIGAVKPGTYTAMITVVTSSMSQSVPVQLVVQKPPAPGAPIMAVSPLTLNFSTTLGQANPQGQAVTITNTGKSPLLWHTVANALSLAWLAPTPAHGTVLAGQSAPFTIDVTANNLTPGTYTGLVMLVATDGHNVSAGGSPQAITVNFTVQAPCALSPPSSSVLAFNALQGAASVTPLPETFVVSGNCSLPLHWNATVLGTASWLTTSTSSGVLSDTNQSFTLAVDPNATGLTPGNYQAKVQVHATDASGQAAQGSGVSFLVTLAITKPPQPCTLQASATSLPVSITLAQSTSSTQQVSMSETGSCALPVNWSATTDSVSSAWMSLSPGSGTTDVPLTVNIDASNLVAGTYQGTITITASDGSGNTVPGGPITIPVTLTVS
ncbi:MAG TPA: hypothetical protein VHZ51_12855, partial [Ktedonobacteraceae bacterium]|nr:hypothetical protein [Ktedonobacteraceae bacterium]